MYRLATCVLLIVLSNVCLAEPNTYQTAPKFLAPESQQDINAPLLSVNPESGNTRVFITPNSLFKHELASQGRPVYHARTLYRPTPSGISDSMIKLHLQMADTCPQGWIKRQEWANLQTNTPELHYQFQCLPRIDIPSP